MEGVTSDPERFLLRCLCGKRVFSVFSLWCWVITDFPVAVRWSVCERCIRREQTDLSGASTAVLTTGWLGSRC